MTPMIDSYLSRWRQYKWALIIFFTLNAFSVICALVLGLYFFSQKSDLGRNQLNLLNEISLVDSTTESIQGLISESRLISQSKGSETKLPHSQIIVSRYTTLLEINKNLEHLGLQSADLKTKESFLLEPKPEVSNENFLEKTLVQLQRERAIRWNNLKSNLEQYNDSIKILILIGALTLICGFLMPLLIFYLMGKAIRALHRELHKTALEMVNSWLTTKANFGEGAFKNVDFWVQILLIAGESTSKFSSHPMSILGGELANLIRNEIKKKNSESAA